MKRLKPRKQRNKNNTTTAMQEKIELMHEEQRHVKLRESYEKEGLRIVVRCPSFCNSRKEKPSENTSVQFLESMPCNGPEPILADDAHPLNNQTHNRVSSDVFYPKGLMQLHKDTALSVMQTLEKQNKKTGKTEEQESEESVLATLGQGI